MNDAIFLHVAAVFNDDLSPVATQNSTGANVNVFTDEHIASDIGLWMHKTRRFDHGDKPIEGIDGHTFYFCVKDRESVGNRNDGLQGFVVFQ